MSIRAQTGGLAAAALLALAVGGILQGMPNHWFDRDPRERLAKREAAGRREVLERGGLVAVWTFDGPELRTWHRDQEEWNPGEPDPYGPAWPGTTSVKGRFGDARRFSGRAECYFNTGRSWKDRTEDFTAALWIKAREFPRKQDVTATAEAGLWGFRLDGDRLCFDVPLERGDWTTVECPFPRDGRWRHVAFAMDKQAGEMRLWVDGERQATEPWLEPLLRDLPFCFGLASEKNDRDPFCGELDDAGVWDRALGDAEIRELAQGGKSLAEFYSTRKTRNRLKRARAQVRWHAALARLRWKNWPRPWAGGSTRLREVDLSLSDGAWRHLSRRHARARASGGLGGNTAAPVDGILAAGGGAVRCRVSLFGGSTYYPDSLRPAYSVVPLAPDAPLPGGAPRWVLSPPESCGWLELLGGAWIAEETGLPAAPACEMVRLRLNGIDRGVYLLRDFSRAGAVAGWEVPCNRLVHPQRAVNHERFWVDPDATSRTVAGALLTFMDESARERLMRRLGEAGNVLLEDRWSPLPRLVRRREIKNRLREFAALRPGPAPARKAMLDDTLFAGNNLSPMRVVEDLPLAAVRAHVPSPARLVFKSLDPEWLDDDGHVLQRPDRFPRRVEVEASYRDPDGGETSQTLVFRIMPERYGVPALAVWSGPLMEKIQRKDAMVEFYPAGDAGNAPAWTMNATRSTQGGVRFRGNSSFRGPRRLCSLKLDGSHGLFPGNPTRMLTMINADTERTRVVNSLAFGLFREFPVADGAVRLAPRVLWAEVFLNGRYLGLQEFAERVDGDLPGADGNWIFHRHATVPPRLPDIGPVRPPPREGDFAGPMRAAKALFAEGESPDWPARAEAMLDLDSFVDFQLLSTLFGNVNGYPKSFVFDEILVFDPETAKFFFIPWDFDLTLKDATRWIATDADRRLWKDVPGYPHRMAARWKELRAGCLASDRLRAKGQALFDGIAAALPTDWETWHPQPGASEESAVRKLFETKMDCMAARAANLDARFARLDDPPNGD